MKLQIVFTHVKTTPPLHLVLNSNRVAKQFKEIEVWLLTEKHRIHNRLFANVNVLSPSYEELQIESTYGYPKEMRNNFWFSSLVRFSLILRHMEISRNPTLHIESDVVLSNDFPLQKFEEMRTPFAFPIVSDKRGIASAVYIRDVEAAQFLWEFVKACVNRDALASDMEILFQLHRDYPAHVTTLPIAPSELFANQEDVLNNTKFDGYFDGHDFGVYLAGTNPWNQRGLSRLHTKMNGSLLDFKADNLYFNKERNFLSLRGDSGIEYPLYSLHITNKNPYFFSVRFGPLFIRLWSERRFLRNITFHPIVFVFMIFNFLRRKINRVVAGLTHQRLQPKNPPKL